MTVTIEEQVAYLTRVAATTRDAATARAAQDILLTKGWQDQMRVGTGPHGGEWTAESSTSKTPERARRDRARADAKDRAESAVQLAGMDAEDDERHRAARAAGKPAGSPVADARRRYGIPSDLGKLPGKRRAAAQALLDATGDLARIARRREALQARAREVQRHIGDGSGLGGRTRRTLDTRATSITRQLAALDRDEAAARRALADATARWGKGKAKAVVPDLTKNGVVDRNGRLHIGAGSREGGRFARMALGDMLGTVGVDRKVGITRYGSHRITGRGPHPADVTLARWHADVATVGAPNIHIDTTGGHDMHAAVNADGARRVADHLRDLIAIGEAGGHKAPAPKRTKQSRTYEIVDNAIKTGEIDPTDQVQIGYGDITVPLTYKDLLNMLAEHAPGKQTQRLRRVVERASDGGDEGEVHMMLHDRDGEPVVLLSGRYPDTRPWNPTMADIDGDEDEEERAGYDQEITSVLSLGEAAELADVMDRYAVEADAVMAQRQVAWDRYHELNRMQVGAPFERGYELVPLPADLEAEYERVQAELFGPPEEDE